jgi:hypothetical protein
MLAGCGHVSAPGVAAKATVSPAASAGHLTWQAAMAPGGELQPTLYAPAPSDGRVTYACAFHISGAAPGAQVWITRNRGVSWSDVAALPYTGALSDCRLVVDANNPLRLVATLNTAKMGASPDNTDLVSFISQDGGATWQGLPQVGPHGVRNLVSFGSALYASGLGRSASGVDVLDVWLSRDGGRSWRALGASSLAPNPSIWLNTQTGELLGTNDFDLIPTLWRSEDGGASWLRISVPTVVDAGGEQTFVVAPVGSGWRICVAGQPAAGSQAKNTLACSNDLGKTWTQPPALNPSQYSPKGFIFIAPTNVFAITDDGGLLATYDDMTSGMEMEALASGASAWVALGAPNSAIETAGAAGTPPDVANLAAATSDYTTGPGGGMLWVDSGDPTHPFITAMYP